MWYINGHRLSLDWPDLTFCCPIELSFDFLIRLCILTQGFTWIHDILNRYYLNGYYSKSNTVMKGIGDNFEFKCSWVHFLKIPFSDDRWWVSSSLSHIYAAYVMNPTRLEITCAIHFIHSPVTHNRWHVPIWHLRLRCAKCLPDWVYWPQALLFDSFAKQNAKICYLISMYMIYSFAYTRLNLIWICSAL